MKEKTQLEITAAQRQVELITKALQGASSEGYWLNPSGKMAPGIHLRHKIMSPFNSLIFAMHSDANGYPTSQYTTFSDARKRGEAILKGERSVPMLWYNWSKMVSRTNPDDIISKEDWAQLSPNEQAGYKSFRQREIISMFNIDQTTHPMADPLNYQNEKQFFGSMTDRGNIIKEEQFARNSINEMMINIRENLVPIRKSTNGEAYYDVEKDAVYMPAQKQYASYPEYVQDMMRSLIASTGHGQRLARQPIMGGKLDSNATAYEQLVQELASGHALIELGMPAKMKPENVKHVEHWINELRTNPCLIDALEADVNSSVDVLRRASFGEKIVFASKKNEQQTDQARKTANPQVSHEEALIIQDILARGGYEIDYRNFPGETDAEQKANKKAFMEKFSNLEYYEGNLLHALGQAERYTKEEPNAELAEVAYTSASNEAARIHKVLTEYLPKEWEQKGSHTIADDMMQVPDKRSREMMIIKDTESGIVDVVLPGNARQGGDVLLPSGERRNFWLTPDEAMSASERKEADATVVRNNIPGFNKDKITTALMAQGAAYVRFYDKEGLLRYRPDDSYFKGKELMAAKLNGKELNVTSRFDVSEAVLRANDSLFDRIQMIKDDNGRWALHIKPENKSSYAVYPDAADVNRFFSTLKAGDNVASDKVRNELAQKYHAMASANSALKVDLFYNNVPDNVDPDRIQRVSIFRTKDEKFMVMPVIAGVPKVQPRELKSSQWQRLWAADDVNAYKKGLAAFVFSDLIQKDQNQSAEVQRTQDMAVEQSRVDTAETTRVQGDTPKAEIANEGVLERLKQYEKMKEKHPNSLLLFRAGDVYQAFSDDAVKAAEILKLKMKSIAEGQNGKINYVEVDHAEFDTALPKLVRADQRVAICEELDNPRSQANRVERDQVLAQKENVEESQPKRMRM